MLIQTSGLMIFQQQKQDNCENENEDCKTAMILTKNKTINSATILTGVFVECNFIVLYFLPLCIW